MRVYEREEGAAAFLPNINLNKKKIRLNLLTGLDAGLKVMDWAKYVIGLYL